MLMLIDKANKNMLFAYNQLIAYIALLVVLSYCAYSNSYIYASIYWMFYKKLMVKVLIIKEMAYYFIKCLINIQKGVALIYRYAIMYTSKGNN